MKHLDIKITGMVQGVFFRNSAKKVANRLGIVGYAKNMPDGSVFIEAEGDEKTLSEFISWCKKGPKLAKVRSCQIFEADSKNYDSFAVN